MRASAPAASAMDRADSSAGRGPDSTACLGELMFVSTTPSPASDRITSLFSASQMRLIIPRSPNVRDISAASMRAATAW